MLLLLIVTGGCCWLMAVLLLTAICRAAARGDCEAGVDEQPAAVFAEAAIWQPSPRPVPQSRASDIYRRRRITAPGVR